MSPAARTKERVFGLDGLRATSIALVLTSHAALVLTRDRPGPFPGILFPGHTGVWVFFGISGFIITTLLLREESSAGRIDLSAFYVRRAARILPALAVFLVISWFLTPDIGWTHYARAALFLSDYWATPHWWLGHTWSLSVEEQFYLLWPVAVWGLGSRRATHVALGLLLAAPVLRLCLYFLLPGIRPIVSHTLHGNMDAILVGCIVAYVRERHPASRAVLVMGTAPVALASSVFLLGVAPWLNDAYGGRYSLPIGTTLQALAVGSILCWAVRSNEGWLRHILNGRAVRHLGLISYSLYLWQEPFFDPRTQGTLMQHVPVALFGALLAAECSYFAVERPVLALRDRLFQRQRAAVARGATA